MTYIIQDRGWRLEKQVPITVILALFLQVAGGLIWAAQLDVRVRGIEKDVDRVSVKLDAISEKLMK